MSQHPGTIRLKQGPSSKTFHLVIGQDETLAGVLEVQPRGPRGRKCPPRHAVLCVGTTILGHSKRSLASTSLPRAAKLLRNLGLDPTLLLAAAANEGWEQKTLAAAERAGRPDDGLPTSLLTRPVEMFIATGGDAGYWYTTTVAIPITTPEHEIEVVAHAVLGKLLAQVKDLPVTVRANLPAAGGAAFWGVYHIPPLDDLDDWWTDPEIAER